MANASSFWNRPPRSISRNLSTFGRALQPMLSLYHFPGALPDYDAGRHRVAGYYTRHDRSVGNTKLLDAIHLEVSIHDTHGIAPHFGCTGLMRIGGSHLANEVLQIDALQITGHYLPFRVRAKRRGVSDFTAEFDRGYRGLHVVRVGQEIVFNVQRIERVRPCQA